MVLSLSILVHTTSFRRHAIRPPHPCMEGIGTFNPFTEAPKTGIAAEQTKVTEWLQMIWGLHGVIWGLDGVIPWCNIMTCCLHVFIGTANQGDARAYHCVVRCEGVSLCGAMRCMSLRHNTA